MDVPLWVEPASLRLAKMSTAPTNDSRPLAVLKLPQYEVPRLVTYARSIMAAMTNNPSFPSPRPPIATVEAAIDALDQAEVATRTRMQGSVAERDAKRLSLKMLLEQLRDYVQGMADANAEHAASLIESAGMAVKKKGGPAARTFTAKQGHVSGSVELNAPQAGNRAAYEWQFSADGMKTWVSAPVTVQASSVVSGLTPGSTVSFRYRTMTKAGTSDWKDPVSILVS